MDFTDFDINELIKEGEFTLLPPGIYSAIIKEANFGKSKSGYAMITLILEIVHNNKKITIRDYIAFTPPREGSKFSFGIMKLKQIIESWGVNITEIPNIKQILTTDYDNILNNLKSLTIYSKENSLAISQLAVKINVIIKNNDGKEFNNIKSYVKFLSELTHNNNYINDSVPF